MPLPSDESRNDRLAPRPPSLLVDFATIWLTGLVIRLALFKLVTGSPLPETSLRWFEQVGLIGLRFVSTIPGTLLFAGCFTAIRNAQRRPSPAAPAVKALAWSVLFGFAFVSMSSWAGYYATGEFLGFEAWSQALASPVLMLDHVVEIAPLALVVVPAAALLVVTVIARLVRWTATWPASRTRALVYGVGGILRRGRRRSLRIGPRVAARYDAGDERPIGDDRLTARALRERRNGQERAGRAFDCGCAACSDVDHASRD